MPETSASKPPVPEIPAPETPVHRSWLVALTTRDGKAVQEHFGHARHFHIVRIEGDGNWVYVESRVCEPGCGGGITHDDPHEARFAPIIELLSDCDAIVTAQIGPGAAAYVLTHGLRIFEARGLVSDILDEVARTLCDEGATDGEDQDEDTGSEEAKQEDTEDTHGS